MMKSWILIILVMTPGTVSEMSVTFTTPDYCAFKGSSVEFSCSYNYTAGKTVTKTAWYKGELKDGKWQRTELSNMNSLVNRTQYLGDKLQDCSLAIHNLQDDDTGYYYFRFDTQTHGWRSQTSVHLSVTELTARVTPTHVRAGNHVTLECETSCQDFTTVWFKDGHPVAKPEFQAQTEDAGNYSCAIKGQESIQSDPVGLDVQYAPLNVSVEVSPAGQGSEGSSVNLTCSSAANPAADRYAWYKRTPSPASPSQLLQVGSGQVLSLPSVGASHAGLYLCQARNRLGESNSTEVLLTVDSPDIYCYVALGVTGVILLFLLTPACIWIGMKRCNSAADLEEDRHDYENIPFTSLGLKAELHRRK